MSADPALPEYVAGDGVGDPRNLVTYGYVFNSPGNYVDPTGRIPVPLYAETSYENDAGVTIRDRWIVACYDDGTRSAEQLAELEIGAIASEVAAAERDSQDYSRRISAVATQVGERLLERGLATASRTPPLLQNPVEQVRQWYDFPQQVEHMISGPASDEPEDIADWFFDSTAAVDRAGELALVAAGVRSSLPNARLPNNSAVSRVPAQSFREPNSFPANRQLPARTRWQPPSAVVDRVPREWGLGQPNKKADGWRWAGTERAASGMPIDNIRIDRGVPDSQFEYQRVDHVVVQSGGAVLGRDGRPVRGSIRNNPEVHIPLTDWMTWARWNSPR